MNRVQCRVLPAASPRLRTAYSTLPANAWLAAWFFLHLLTRPAPAQDNYEIQVYGVETVPSGETMVELHSNYTFDGNKTVNNGVLPSRHAFHETLEVTRGFTP